MDHKISIRGIEVDKAKIDVIEKLPPPVNVNGIMSFLEHARLYRRFVKDFSKIARPLCNLLNKDAVFQLDEEFLTSFQALKNSLVSASIMVAPDWSKEIDLMCDTNDYAVGVILRQQREKVFHAIIMPARSYMMHN